MASSVASRAIARQLQQLIQHNDVPDERIAQIMHEAVATSVEPIAAQLELVLLESAKIDALREAEREAEREADSARCGFDAVNASQRAGGDDGVACERLSGDDTGLREGGVRERLSTRSTLACMHARTCPTRGGACLSAQFADPAPRPFEPCHGTPCVPQAAGHGCGPGRGASCSV